MNSSQAFAVGSLIALSGCFAHGKVRPESARPELRSITVKLYEFSPIRHATLLRAEAQTDRIFRDAGILVKWTHCRADSKLQAACPDGLASNEIALRIVTRRLRLSERPIRLRLGLAWKLDGARGSGFATIYYNLAVEVASARRLPLSIVLGYIIAHEIGHVLLPLPGHSPEGIMRAQFGEYEWQLARLQRLRFTPQQAEVLRQFLGGFDRGCAMAATQPAASPSRPLAR